MENIREAKMNIFHCVRRTAIIAQKLQRVARSKLHMEALHKTGSLARTRKLEAFDRHTGTEFEQPNTYWIIICNSAALGQHDGLTRTSKASIRRKHLIRRSVV